MSRHEGNLQMRVEFLIDGDLPDSTLARFPELEVARGPAGGTVLFGDVVDRAHLDGILARFRSLDVAVVEFRQLPS